MTDWRKSSQGWDDVPMWILRIHINLCAFMEKKNKQKKQQSKTKQPGFAVTIEDKYSEEQESTL